MNAPSAGARKKVFIISFMPFIIILLQNILTSKTKRSFRLITETPF